MGKVNRAQFSLLFDDAELYKNLIEPYKNSKELNPLVLRLLSVYYHNSEIRSMIDSAELVESSNSTGNQIESVISSVKENFFLLNTCIESGKGTLEHGVQQMVQAYEQGIAKKQDENYDKFGSMNSPLILGDVKRMKEEEEELAKIRQEEEEKANKLKEETTIASITKEMSEMKDKMNKLMEIITQNGIQTSPQTSNKVVVEQGSSQFNTQKIYTEPVEEEKVNNLPSHELGHTGDYTSYGESPADIEKLQTEVDIETEVEAEDDLDGSDAIANLLKSVQS